MKDIRYAPAWIAEIVRTLARNLRSLRESNPCFSLERAAKRDVDPVAAYCDIRVAVPRY